MIYTSWLVDILSVVREVSRSANKNGLIIIIMIIILVLLIFCVLNKNKKN